MNSTTPRVSQPHSVTSAKHNNKEVVEQRVLLARFGGQLSELSEVVYVSAKATTDAILKRVYKHLVSVEDPVQVWLDTDQLAHKGSLVDVASVVSSLLYTRSAAGRRTHLKVVVNATPKDLDSVVQSATIHANDSFDVDEDGRVPLSSCEVFEKMRMDFVRQALRDFQLTENQVFEWYEAVAEGMVLGSVEFQVANTHAGADYVMVGIGADAEMMAELLIVRNERCADTAPFTGVGVAVEPWSPAGEEVERKLSERWAQASELSARVHVKEFVSVTVANWDQKMAAQADVATSHSVAPGILAVLVGGVVEHESKPSVTVGDGVDNKNQEKVNPYVFDVVS